MPDTNGYTAHEVVQSQRSAKGLTYERWTKGLDAIRRSGNSKHKEMMKRLNAEMLSLRSVSSSSVHSNALMTNLSVQYANDEYIGERLMPAVTVSKRSDDYAIYPKRERLAYPDDALGARSQANELDESRTSGNYSVRDYGFKNFVSQQTLENEDPIFDEMFDLIEAINEGIAFKREKRQSKILTTAANFGGNTVTLAGSNQWNGAGGGDPIAVMQTARSAMWQGRGATEVLGYCGLEVFNVLARHPSILDLLKYQRSGLATRTELATVFGLDDLLIGAAREDTANKGQAEVDARIWGKHFGIVRVAKRATKRSAHFGSTFRMNGDPVTTQWFEPDAGKAGGFYGKVGVSEDSKVVAGDTGYLVLNAVA
jgi:hypothetical protein